MGTAVKAQTAEQKKPNIVFIMGDDIGAYHQKYESLRTPENGWSIQEAGMAQLDDIVGAVMKYLKDNVLEDNIIVVFSTDNGAENFTWPDGGQTPFSGSKRRPWKMSSGCLAFCVGRRMRGQCCWTTSKR